MAICRITVVAMLLMGAARAQEDPEGVAFFEKRIRPVLVDRCYRCHSTGAEKVKGELYLDSRARMLQGGETGPAIVSGNPETSLLVKAIRYKDDHLKMPPKGRLPDAVIRDFEEWIRRGAPDPRTAAAVPRKKKKGIDIEAGKKYWAFQPLKRVDVPDVKNKAWCRTPIDRFVAALLEEKGLAPNAEVDRRKLIRRATFDLVGLPPTPEEVDAFVRDASPRAYEKLIDRLLGSRHYGERWARHWLDVARFAESHGFEQDYDRKHAYPYRDFVIRALNRDMPYDRFVQWQIAGDELAPDDPLAWMATGFLGAGVFPTQLTEVEFEPSRYDELDNMAATMGNAMLGLTIGCARCHDHKFDPISTRDYYRLISTFTTAIRSELDFELNPEEHRKALAEWEKERAPLVAERERFEKEDLPARFARWAAGGPDRKRPSPAWMVLDDMETKSHGGATFRKLEDGSFLATGDNPRNDKWSFTARTRLTGITAVRLETLAHPSLKKGGPGRAGNGNFALSVFRISARPLKGTGKPIEAKMVTAKATFQQNRGSLSVAGSIDGDRVSGWAVDPQFGKDHAAVFEFDKPIGFDGGMELTFHFEFNNNVHHSIGRPRLSVTTRPRPVGLKGDSARQALVELLAVLGTGKLKPDQQEAVLKAYRTVDPEWRKRDRAIQDHRARKPKPALTKVMVTTEGRKPIKHHADGRGFPHFYKETYFLGRGDTNRKQGVATQAFLRVLMNAPEMEKRWQKEPPEGARSSHRRAALARWLTDTEAGAGALLARVIVNRLWQHHLGRGIVATPNDFGLQGQRPTHPELLDWLATELIARGWRLKEIHRLITTSAAYRQSTAFDPAKSKVDPENRLFWRREFRRLEGEAIRDSMLSLGGLLDTRMFGPGTLDEANPRRSIYFMIKRSKLIPMMQLFDAPEALVSIGRRSSTTVAPQALMFMNNSNVRRYATGFARRLAPEAGRSLEAAVEAGYRLAISRAPTPDERQANATFIREQEASYRKEGRPSPRELALADFCQVLFGLNEFLYVE